MGSYWKLFFFKYQQLREGANNKKKKKKKILLEGMAHKDGEERYAELLNQVTTLSKSPLLLTFVDFSWKVCLLLQLVFWLQILPF